MVSITEYRRCTVEGVLCIVWNPMDLPDESKLADRVKTARGKLKDSVATVNQDLIMLDTSTNSRSGDRHYCDLIPVIVG